MTAPAGIAFGKLFVPETVRRVSKDELPEHNSLEEEMDEMAQLNTHMAKANAETGEANVLHAAGNGAIAGFCELCCFIYAQKRIFLLSIFSMS